MNLKIVCFFVICFLLPFFANTQITNLKFRQYGTTDGLSSSFIQYIYQDQQGFMWFGTRDGINKYDGYKFAIFKRGTNKKNTISSNDIKSILQDDENKIWLATSEGSINILDVKTEKINLINNGVSTEKKISNSIPFLYKDHKGNVWIGSSDQGLYVINNKTKLFKQYNITSSISSIIEDSKGNIWIGTVNDGIQLINKEGTVGKKFSRKDGTSRGLSDDHIKFIFQDSKKRLWIGTYGGGLNLFDENKEQFAKVPYESLNATDGDHDFLLSMEEDRSGNLWIGTENKGLSIYNPDNGKTVSYRHIDNDNSSIGSNTINCIKRDSKGNMWIGTAYAGISMVNLDESQFVQYKNVLNSNSLSNNIVNSIFETSSGKIWIGTDGGGLNLFDPQNNTFKSFIHKTGNTAGIGGNYVLTIAEDSAKNLWIGTWGNGITIFNTKKQSFKHFTNNPSDPNSLSSNYAFSIIKDSKNRIWIGTYGGGLNLYNEKNNSFTHFVNNNDLGSISSNYILTIKEDSKGNIWIGTDGGGLNRYNESKRNFAVYTTNSNLKTGSDKLSNNNITSIWEDKKGLLWLGTNYGLNVFNPATSSNKTYFSENGLSNDAIGAVIGDQKGFIWISTNKGVCRFDPQNHTFQKFSTADGLQADEFKYARCIDKNGNIYFGGRNGFNVFTPDKIKAIPYDPPIVFTNFQIFNNNVKVAEDEKDPSPLKSSISLVKKIILTYKQSSFSFEFASLNYTANEKKQYQYTLEGFDKQWHNIGSRNSLSYTNLDPGNYILKIKGLNSNQQWSEKTAQIEIVIVPPFWKTGWFKAILTLLIIGCIVLLFYVRLSSIKNRNRQLQKEVKLRTQELSEINSYLKESNEKIKHQNENLEEVNREILRKTDKILQQQEHIVAQNLKLESTVKELENSNKTKDKFFSILAHDLKNPITALSGLAGLIKSRLTQLNNREIYNHINDISKSADSVNNLVINLLDWARTQSDNLEYTPISINLYQLIIKNISLAKIQLAAKNISCHVGLHPSHTIFADHPMINTVIRNIIGNSIKFTPNGGKITIQSKETANEIAVIITDSGIGLSAEQIEQLKQRQFQGSVGTAGETGTGLGLQISKDFIDINKGTLQIKSVLGTGSVFTITLPKLTEAGQSADFVPEETETDLTAIENDIESAQTEETKYSLPEVHRQMLKGKRILIVDDDFEIRNYIKVFLSDIFEIFEAENGLDGLRDAKEIQPDLIISDLIMPVMNGVEFCQETKNNVVTSHIPLILLTGETTEENQLSSYDAGADIYLTKPFNRQILLKVIFNQINRQEIIRRKYSVTNEIIPVEVEYNKIDKEFLNKMSSYIEKNLSNYDLDYKKLCEESAMSRTVLYAKFKTLTGLGVHDFIKNIRLKKSLKLLQEGRLNISQIAYEVGFATPSYFSKSFLKQYKVSPKEYVTSFKKNPGALKELSDIG